MRKLLFICILFILLGNSCKKDDETSPYTEVTVSMDANSASDVYFSLANGEVKIVNRTDWDIAFSVPLQTATILINEGAGVELYCVGDTNDWESIDENSITSLQPLYNDKSNWSIGAFNVNASGFPNYGWGTYHHATDHNVWGDSIYVIKLTNGSLKKLHIRMKIGATSANAFRWADLDGANLVEDTFATTPYYNVMNFIHYSLVNKEIVEVEPEMNDWDLLFTRYVALASVGGVTMNYPVTGILSNPGISVAKVTGISPENALDTDAAGGYSTNADVIGYDWKVSDPITHEVSLVDSVSYFIQATDSKKYQLYFTNYGGLTAGTISFKVKTVE
jgi:hypothetical protein